MTWEFFRQTGNIEAYLLLKELEKEQTEANEEYEEKEVNQIDQQM